MRIKHPVFIALALLAAIGILIYCAWLVVTGRNHFALLIYVVVFMIILFLPRGQ